MIANPMHRLVQLWHAVGELERLLRKSKCDERNTILQFSRMTCSDNLLADRSRDGQKLGDDALEFASSIGIRIVESDSLACVSESVSSPSYAVQ